MMCFFIHIFHTKISILHVIKSDVKPSFII